MAFRVPRRAGDPDPVVPMTPPTGLRVTPRFDEPVEYLAAHRSTSRVLMAGWVDTPEPHRDAGGCVGGVAPRSGDPRPGLPLPVVPGLRRSLPLPFAFRIARIDTPRAAP
ncbi:hypothetical protein [Dactylosporangium sp. NPDC049140]|uniref:hypothetical protein n=1 Tax=Dactylosporangium sp. NPDC049140 TaxID=3155647 RepID=UPI0033D837BF